MLPRMRTILTAALGDQVRGSAAFRVSARYSSLQGLCGKRHVRPGVHVPKFRRGRKGHHRVDLTPAQRALVAEALSRSPEAVRLGIIVIPAEVRSLAESFSDLTFTAGNAVRRPYDTTHRSPQSDFLATTAETGVQGAQAGRVLRVLRVALTTTATDRIQQAAGGAAGAYYLPCEVVVATVYSQLYLAIPPAPSFGYTIIDSRHSQEAYVPAASLGGPIGIVRSPRHGTPAFARWLIETHATRRAVSSAWRAASNKQ
jgi:hypothetical protein